MRLPAPASGWRQVWVLRLRSRAAGPVAWGRGVIGRELVDNAFFTPLHRWSFLASLLEDSRDAAKSYNAPGVLRAALAAKDSFAEGDLDRDGFDESQGCYYLRGQGGRCRFTLTPPPGGVVRPVFRVAGPWRGDVAVSWDGQAIRDTVLLQDGSILFILEGRVTRAANVEISDQP